MFLQSVLSDKAPFLIISFLCILGAVPGLYLPETAEIKMPETLEDIEELGRWVDLSPALTFFFNKNDFYCVFN